MTTFLQDEIARVPGESVIPTDTAALLATNPTWTLTGDVWETTTTSDVTVLDWWTTGQYTEAALTPRMGYVLTVDVHAPVDVQMRWLAHVTYDDDGIMDLADGAANTDPVTLIKGGDWTAVARAWNAPAGVTTGSFTTEITAPAGTPIKIRAPFAAPLDGPLVVGHVAGASFRTTDDLPGQVTFADDALNYGGTSGPGVRVEPADITGYTAAPGIGPAGSAMVISGGIGISGERTDLTVSQTAMQTRWEGSGRASFLRVEDDRVLAEAQRSDGVSAGVNVGDGSAQIWGGVGADAGRGPFGQIYTNDFISRIESRNAAGTVTALIEVQDGMAALASATGKLRFQVSADGATVSHERGGVPTQYNLDDRLAAIEARLDALET